jgi:dimethylaniline monooxygenase (N-oxide forming)
VAPSLANYPELAPELFFGLLAPAQFRMEGHGRQPDARARFEHNVRYFTAGEPLPLTPQYCDELHQLAILLPQHQGLHQLLEQLTA